MEHERGGDTFGGYKLRQIEERLIAVQYGQVQLERILGRISKKLDLLGSGMTPEDIKAAIAQLEADAQQVTAGMTELNKAADKLEGV